MPITGYLNKGLPMHLMYFGDIILDSRFGIRIQITTNANRIFNHMCQPLLEFMNKKFNCLYQPLKSNAFDLKKKTFFCIITKMTFDLILLF